MSKNDLTGAPPRKIENPAPPRHDKALSKIYVILLIFLTISLSLILQSDSNHILACQIRNSPAVITMSLSNKLAITDVDLQDKRVLIRVSPPQQITFPSISYGGPINLKANHPIRFR